MRVRSWSDLDDRGIIGGEVGLRSFVGRGVTGISEEFQ